MGERKVTSRYLGRPYCSEPSSPLSQPMTLSVFRGSGRSQSKHWNVRLPLPSGGSAKTSGAPHSGHVGRSAWPMEQYWQWSKYSSTLDSRIPNRKRAPRGSRRQSRSPLYPNEVTSSARLVTSVKCAPNERRAALFSQPWRRVLIWRGIARRHDAGVKVRAGRSCFFGDHELTPRRECADLNVPVRKHDDRPVVDVHKNRGHQPGIGRGRPR